MAHPVTTRAPLASPDLRDHGAPGDPLDGAARGHRPEDVFPHGRRCRPRRRRRVLHGRQGPDPRHRRRVRLRQERHLPDDHGAEPQAVGEYDRNRALEGRGSADGQPEAAARDPRQRDRDDLPGPDDEPEPGPQDRQPARRGDAPPRGRLEEAGPCPCARAAEGGRHPASRAAARRLSRTSSPAVCASA